MRITTTALLVSLLLIMTGISTLISGGEGVEDTRAINSSEYEQNMNISIVATTSIVGDYLYQYLGDHMARSSGDLNGDGFDDIVIGDPNFDLPENTNIGRVLICFGGPHLAGEVENETDFDIFICGEGPGGGLGSSVDIVGDINGDGYDDLAVGAPSYDQNGLLGKMYIILGGEDRFSVNFTVADADASYLSEGAGDFFGTGITSGGDLNGDDIDDMVVGANFRSQGSLSMVGKLYVIFGRTDGWERNVSIADADASYLGEENYQYVGGYNVGGGDVNGDGYCDILLGVPYTNVIGSYQGRVYVVMGRSGEWGQNLSLSGAEVSIDGEDSGDYFGMNLGCMGDVNGDGLDDMIFGADRHDTPVVGGGKAYLLLGRTTGWDSIETLDDVDATFSGSSISGHLGSSISLVDIDMDGLTDVFIGAEYEEFEGQRYGRVYLFMGRTSGWSHDMAPGTSDASFLAEYHSDFTGASMSHVGDITGSGQDCLLIGATCSKVGGTFAGKVFLISGSMNAEPLAVSSVKIFENLALRIEMGSADRGDMVYIELEGVDCNETRRDYATVNISFSTSPFRNKSVLLRENDVSSGIFRGEFVVPPGINYFDIITFSSKKDPSKRDIISIDRPSRPAQVGSISVYSDGSCSTQIDLADLNETIYVEVRGTDASPLTVDHAFVNVTGDVTSPLPIVLMGEETGINTGIYRSPYRIDDGMVLLENMTIRSVRSPSVTAMVKIRTHVQIGPVVPIKQMVEDGDYVVQYSNLGWASPITWSFDTDGDWLFFNDDTLELYGTPDNSDVGPTSVWINVTDGVGHFDEQRFSIEVSNTDPMILTGDVLEAYQGQDYHVDYNSDEDGQGSISWFIFTDAAWLSMDASTGELSGNPSGDDIGIMEVSVGVFDGNGGKCHSHFKLSVQDLNDAPAIISDDIKSVNQGDPYKRWYEAVDPDTSDDLTWFLGVESSWLSINAESGLLEGIPTNSDVGENLVNVSVKDLGGLTASHEFILTVHNVNDAPVWVDVPGNQDVMHGSTFEFDINAEDVDVGTELKYFVTTAPSVDLTIDRETGELIWAVSIDWFESSNYKLNVDVSVNDGEVVKHHKFILTVVPSTPSTVTLGSPGDGTKVSPITLVLEWEGKDEEGDDLTYDIYLSDNEPFVSSLNDEVKIIGDWEGESFIPYVLEPGRTYYWTVIPNDGCSNGKCLNGRFSFKVNEMPEIEKVRSQSAVVGDAFELLVMVDDGDDNGLRYSLDAAPDGMTIDADLGFIDWVPMEDQEGDHKVIVNVTDGIDFVQMSFLIEVERSGPSVASMVGIIGAAVMALVLISLCVGFLVWKKGRSPAKEEGEITMDDVDWGEDDEVEDVSSGLCAVATTVDQAHRRTGKQQDLSYEDLYGSPAPKEEEELTTRQLKEFISGQIRELEGSAEE